jgi:hypothetical protein
VAPNTTTKLKLMSSQTEEIDVEAGVQWLASRYMSAMVPRTHGHVRTAEDLGKGPAKSDAVLA